jgi:DNA-binding response OmpR family regulator
MARVLVVDDEPGYRASLEFFLAQAGNDVVAVATAQEAIEQAAHFEPGILVVDWLLGERSTGADLARQLSARLPQLQVILMTGLGASMVRQQISDLNIVGVLEKPFEPQIVIEAVRAAANGHNTAHGPVGS